MAHIGFSHLKEMLSKRKGIKNPGAVAAAIGRKKYGSARMAEASREHKPANKVK